MDCAKWSRIGWLLAALTLLPPAALPAEEQCKLLKLADVPVSLEGRQPVITAKINGVDAVFAVDSGAFWSTLSTAAGSWTYGWASLTRPSTTMMPPCSRTLRMPGHTTDVALRGCARA